MRNIKSKILLLVLNSILFMTILLSEYVYTSYYPQVSWHENSGTQFLVIVMISVPMLLVLSIIYYFVGKKGVVKGLNKNLPLLALLVFMLPILLDGSLSFVLITIGTILGAILTLISIWSVVKSIISKENN
ncbi:hypothetical protein PBV87_00960 [Niameybacter massiliensis]|uniref:Uncharacterized protein n=1 Tax=Holtiella tumoricola TaxID=3018743 RepID=A0AA42IYX1_9FIRM|nr:MULTISPECIES: hypothetical protein [Lachnospirales]MDA3730083.1 hypothetical protein [Holtiella tumoricola]